MERIAKLSKINEQLRLETKKRKQVEEALRKIQKRYALATHAARVGVWDWNVQTNEFYLDRNIKEILGYNDNEIPKLPTYLVLRYEAPRFMHLSSYKM